MWIKTTNDALERLLVKEVMDEAVEFSKNGTAQVPKEVGEYLVDNYDSIEEYDTESDDDDEEVDESVEEVVVESSTVEATEDSE